MIRGVVSPVREAVIPLELVGREGQVEPTDVAVDTGFTAFLTLPAHTFERLDLPFLGVAEVELADGSTAELAEYEAALMWDDRQRVVPALESDGGALAGMSLLYGSRLSMEVLDGGAVTIEPLV